MMSFKKFLLKMCTLTAFISISLGNVESSETSRDETVEPFEQLDLKFIRITQRQDFDGLPINCEMGKKVEGTLSVFEIEGRKFSLQKASHDSFLSFFNATGLDYSHGFGRYHAFRLLLANQDNNFIRLAVFNELVSLLEAKAERPKTLDDAMDYRKFERETSILAKLEEDKTILIRELKGMNEEINRQEREKGKIGTADKFLYELQSKILELLSQDDYQEISKKRELRRAGLLESAKTMKAFSAYLQYFADGRKPTVCLNRVQDDDITHLTLIDALSFLHDIGLRIYVYEELMPEKEQIENRRLKLFHSFVPPKSNRIAYLLLDKGEYAALLPTEKM